MTAYIASSPLSCLGLSSTCTYPYDRGRRRNFEQAEGKRASSLKGTAGLRTALPLTPSKVLGRCI